MPAEPLPAAVRITSYNILADVYISERLYPSIEPAVLDWTRRGPAIVARAAALAPEILCLQEVQASHWPDLEHAFAQRGWLSSFRPKGRSRPDGCALLYRAESVRMVATEALYFDDGEDGAAASGHLALICDFETALGRLRVATTHLRWQAPSAKPEGHIGYRQAVELLRHLDWLGKENSCPCGTVVCGDFNVAPGGPISQLFLQHGFVDAYACSPQATCNPNRRASRIDFLFATRELSAAAEPILPLTNDTQLPNAEEPSDHLPITANFTAAGG